MRNTMRDVTPEQFSRIELLLLDVDGVLTDGRIVYSDAGAESKAFHVRDGSGLKLWRQSGKKAAIVSGRSSPVIRRRAQELGIELVEEGAEQKIVAFRRILLETGLRADQVCAIGDDLPDLPVVSHSGLSVAVADAVPELKAAASFVTSAPGGSGAVREAIEWLMRGQGTWDAAVELVRSQSL
jgi:3-deoxy-D-manno-octulosonate 8-phosphate phosphatase (KDO 8-P phosphatase)